jgi:hypothetical protein
LQTVEIEPSADCSNDKLVIDDGVRKENICGTLKPGPPDSRWFPEAHS